jgi:hypothetical protein
MDDELRQVQEEIVATKADLTEAKADKDRELVLMYGNLLVRLYDEEARVEARLSAGEMHYNMQ